MRQNDVKRRSKGATALHKAALNDNHEVLKELIAFGAEIDARDAYGNTPPWGA
ncbi:ankyrin repeat domain-containing protein [Paraburkholderia phymatum]|uniref:Ankyrin repeat domain-containing protein n=1 Tax=Paraburkholderia phymatum TaxID=148447 RepID=A0ACC6UC12_9BURK